MSPAELKRKREQLGMTQAELAEKLGVHAMTVSAWERGLREIPKASEMAIRLLEKES